MSDVTADSGHLKASSELLTGIVRAVEQAVVGQRELIDSMLIGLLADGHVLLEGVPGLAKSLAVQSLSTALGGTFRRIQFTPDLLPADLLGTQVYQPNTGEWTVREGPVFANFVLADEINRAPAKVQSALLEAMQERQVSLAGDTRPLPRPFLVLATQNPLDQDGTYALPEAQLDRFMLKVVVDYPTPDQELEVVRRMARNDPAPRIAPVASPADVLAARDRLDSIHVDERLLRYAVALVGATRRPAEAGLPDLEPLIRYGASPRASIALTQAAKARALLDGEGFVSPSALKAVAPAVLRHRLIPSFEAEARDCSSDDLVTRILETVPVP